MAEPLTAENFLPHVDKVFRVQGDSHALTLVKVEMQGPEAAGSALRQPFNLIFSGPPGNVLSEGLYKVEVEGGPQFELYVMPVHTPVPDRQNYQAAFN